MHPRELMKRCHVSMVNLNLISTGDYLFFLSDHDTASSLEIDLLPPGAEMLVCFHELFPDRDALGAMLLALAALNA